MSERIVVNTGPIITLGKFDVLDIIGQLPYKFITPAKVQEEINAGISLGYSIEIPSWLEVVGTAVQPSPLALASLDAGEAAVIETAVEFGISTVCIDELKGRRAAVASGLTVVGSLGLIGKAKSLGLIGAVRPLFERVKAAGIYYDVKLLEDFLTRIGE